MHRTAAAPTSRSPAPRVSPIRHRGWNDRETEWLTLVCLHSGLFTRSQYLARYGVSAQTAGRLVHALLDAGLAHEGVRLDRGPVRPVSVCHLHARALYRALGIENHRHRRRASPEVTIRRLLCLDYILEHPEQTWLPTEADKTAYFERLGIAPDTLPQRPYTGPCTVRPARRYVALNVPIASYGPTTTFVYTDAGARHRTPHQRLRAWASAHEPLWDALRERRQFVHVVAVARTDDAAAANAAVLETWRGPPAPAVSLSEADQQLLDEVELADSTGDLSLLNRHGGWLEAGRAARRIHDQREAARAPARHIDACSTHVAERLAPDVLAL